MAAWAQWRRQDLLELLDRMDPTIEELTAAVEQEARKRPEVLRLMTHPGVGALTALAFALIIGTPSRFHRGKQIGSYLEVIPSEDSSGDRQRLGHISRVESHGPNAENKAVTGGTFMKFRRPQALRDKQGHALLRFLLVEAAQAAARSKPHWRRRYVHLAMRREKSIAKVAMGRRLGVRLRPIFQNTVGSLPR